MYKSTYGDTYKPHDPEAYRREQPEDERVGERNVAVDPILYKSTYGEDYKPYEDDAYRREQPE
ncbi:putative microtubule-associated protein, partial [Leptomonas seymouri]